MFDKAVVEMFSRVGIDTTAEEARKYAEEKGAQWYKTRTWTTEEENDFRKWLVAEIKKNGVSNKKADAEASFFLLMYGWSIEDSQ